MSVKKVSVMHLNKLRNAIFAVGAATVLAACGGGSSSSSGGGLTSSTPSAGAVKGPITGGTYTISEIASIDASGNIVTGTSIPGVAASGFGVEIDVDEVATLQKPLLVEISCLDSSGNSTCTDNSTGLAADPIVNTFKAVVTEQSLNTNAAVYLTPLSTIIVELAAKRASGGDTEQFGGQIEGAESVVLTELGVGIDASDIDIQTAPLFYTDDTTTGTSVEVINKINSVNALRTSNELIASLLVEAGATIASLVDDLTDDTFDNDLGIGCADAGVTCTDAPTSEIENITNVPLNAVNVVGGSNTIQNSIQNDLVAEVSITGGSADTVVLNDVQPGVSVPATAGEFADLPAVADTDGDGVFDLIDNCIDDANDDQLNSDTDAFGDACDDFPNDGERTQDNDGDGLDDGNGDDNCPTVANPDQINTDANNTVQNSSGVEGLGGPDNLGDACDVDDDGDGVIDADDIEPLNQTLATDPDGDGIDTNDGGLLTGPDNCPSTANPDQANFDGDVLDISNDETGGDVCDQDADNDGARKDVDVDDLDPSIGDGSNDTDSDGVLDATDNCPFIANGGDDNSGSEGSDLPQANTDGDLRGNACDDDDDGDSFLDVDDPNRLVSTQEYFVDHFSAFLDIGGVANFSIGSIGLNAEGSVTANVLNLGDDGAGNGSFAYDSSLNERIADLNATGAGAGLAAAVADTTGTAPAGIADPNAVYSSSSKALMLGNLNLVAFGQSFIGIDSSNALVSDERELVTLLPESTSAPDVAAEWGIVEFANTFTSSTATNYVESISNVSEITFDNSGGGTSISSGSVFSTNIGVDQAAANENGAISYSASAVGAASVSVDVTGSGSLTLGSDTLTGAVSADANLMVFQGVTSATGTDTQTLKRAYGVRLPESAPALAASYELRGIGIGASDESTTNRNGLSVANFESAILAFDASNNATLTFDASGFSAVDYADNVQPEAANGSIVPSPLTSVGAVTVGANGKFGPVQFVDSNGLTGVELEGFVTANGLLLRVIDTLAVELTGGGTTNSLAFSVGVLGASGDSIIVNSVSLPLWDCLGYTGGDSSLVPGTGYSPGVNCSSADNPLPLSAKLSANDTDFVAISDQSNSASTINSGEFLAGITIVLAQANDDPFTAEARAAGTPLADFAAIEAEVEATVGGTRDFAQFYMMQGVAFGTPVPQQQ